MINKRFNRIIVELAKKEENIITKEQLMFFLSCSESKALEEIDKVNVNLTLLGLPLIEQTGDQFFISALVQHRWNEVIIGRKFATIVYSESDRQALLYLITFTELENLSVFHYQSFLRVSRNTVLADIKKMRKKLERMNIQLTYSRRTGFHLVGNEKNVRTVARKYILKIAITETGKWGLSQILKIKTNTFYWELTANFEKFIQNNELSVVPSHIEETIWFIGLLLCRRLQHPVIFSKQELQELEQLNIYKLSELFLKEYTEDEDNSSEIAYFTIILMTIVQGDISDTSLNHWMQTADKIIRNMERLAVVNFSNRQKFAIDLFSHLVPAIYRIKYKMPLSNVMIDQIKESHEELFELTKSALYQLEEEMKTVIPEDEVGYFTILFGGQIAHQTHTEKISNYRGIIVCPNGISSSLIMSAELKKLFPTIEFKGIYLVSEVSQLSDAEYDMIFTSAPIASPKKVYQIRPLLTTKEKNQLLHEVQHDFLIPGLVVPSINEIVEIILDHVDLRKGITKEKLLRTVTNKVMKEVRGMKEDGPMLNEILDKDTVQVSDEKLDWEEAIALSAKPLVNNGSIEKKYIEAMINKVKEFGAFIHIGEGVALPHARPEDGVNKLGMSLLKMKEPVFLLDDEKHPIRIFICLAAVDNEMHLRALSDLTKILSHKEKLQCLLEAKTQTELLKIINEGVI